MPFKIVLFKAAILTIANTNPCLVLVRVKVPEVVTVKAVRSLMET